MTEPHTIDHADVVAAFADGEAVDAAALEAALADAAARSHLIDILVLRGFVGEAAPVRPSRVVRSSASAPRRRSWTAASAAAIVVLGIGLGFAAGRGSIGRTTVPPSGADAAAIVDASGAAPAPTHVIQMENGVNWNETAGRAGGN